MITYATKIWQGEYPDAFNRHPEADLVIANNMRTKIIDIGETEDIYFKPEMTAIKKAKGKYLVWYASDVIPPTTDWVKDAIKLLEDYSIVSPFWEDNYDDFVLTAEREGQGSFKKTDFGFEDQLFSDQAFIAKLSTLRKIDYNIDHPIKKFYPPHGGNSFERRVAQWLARSNKKRAVLWNHRYKHISKGEKQ